MSKYLVFRGSLLSARYDSSIHGNAIPADATEVADELFFRTINESDGVWTLIDGAVVKLPLPDLTITELISAKLLDINQKCESAIAVISNGYPTSEVLSWPKQEREARAYEIDAAAATPLIDALATARGIAKAELVSRIIEKADLFAKLSGQLIGKRQGLEDQLQSMQAALDDPALPDPTAAEVEAVQW